tara:strand:- start:6440 stop:6829 length:390 start_codon:yes stop_codon:yes gene_type:complete
MGPPGIPSDPVIKPVDEPTTPLVNIFRFPVYFQFLSNKIEIHIIKNPIKILILSELEDNRKFWPIKIAKPLSADNGITSPQFTLFIDRGIIRSIPRKKGNAESAIPKTGSNNKAIMGTIINPPPKPEYP